MEYKDKFKEIRKRLQLTQEKFAEGLEVEKSHIGQIEAGKRQPGMKTIQKICSAYNIDPREFFETEKKPVIKTKDPLITELEKVPTDKKNMLLKQLITEKNMSINAMREILKHTEKDKLWERTSKRKKSKAG